MVEVLDEWGTETITSLINGNYRSGHIPQDLLKSVFIALPKKLGGVECELHRTISLMSHVSEALLRVMMLLRVRNRIMMEIRVEQCGFLEGNVTASTVYLLRTIMEFSVEVHPDLYLCIIDYIKAFDTVKHQETMKIPEGINIDGKELRIIKNTYWKQIAAVRVDN